MANMEELNVEELENAAGGANYVGGKINYDTGRYKYHTVQRNENLSVIGDRNNCTWQIIYQLNRGTIGSNPNLIQPGMTLRIPY